MSVTRILFLVLFQGFQSGILSQKWEFPTEIVALIGSCVEIPCTYSPAKSSIVWYLYDSLYYYEVFNSKTSSSVRNDYIRRTSLVPGGICSLRIDPVRETDKGRYYPGKDRSQNAYDLQSRTITLHVTDTQRQPTLIGSGNMMAGKVSIIQCYADHTCATSPPSLEWNKPGQTKIQSIQLSGGNWKEISQLTYIPSYADDKTPLRCTATYPNGLRSQQEAPLNINFSPKNVIVTLRGNNKLIEGSDVTLSCKSLSNPPIHTYEWYKGKNKIRLRNPWPEIIVRNLTRDIEPYSCAAVNNEGRGESALTEIPVQYAPTGVLIIESQAEDGPTVLTCYYMSSRPNVTHYSWLKDNSLLPNETRQTLMMDKSEEHYGSYTCVAHNSVGTSFSQAVNIAAENNDSLLVILWALGGVLLLFLLLLVIFFFIRRRNSKSAHDASPILGTTNRIPFPAMMGQDGILEKDHEYGNIERKRSPVSPEQRLEDNIYSNEIMNAFSEVEYSAIAHDQTRSSHLKIHHAENVEYATVKH